MSRTAKLALGILAPIVVGIVIAVIVVAASDGDDASPEAAEPTAEATAQPTEEATPDAGGDSAELPEPLELVTVGWQTDWANRTIELDELIVGINSLEVRDQIRPIDEPVFDSVADAHADNADDEPGLLLELDGEARFYPLRIMTVHEIVNDELGGRPLAVTYCPLCNSALVFDRTVNGEVLRFGTSGLLRNSDLVMWDSATESLWQQIGGEAIVGELAGTLLDPIPASIVSWADFRADHPDGEVLSQNQQFGFNYGFNPYEGYSSRTTPFGGFFDESELDDRFPALERVVGVSVDDRAKAYPFSVIEPVGAVNDEIGGVPLAVLWGSDTADALDADVVVEGEAIGTAIAFDRRVADQTLTFSPTEDGRFTDAETGSTWSILGKALDGPLAGEELAPVVHSNEFWFAWSAFNEGGEVYG